MELSGFNLRDLLHFDPDRGAIELFKSRMMLFNMDALATMRRVMYDQAGERMARMMLASFGYESATRDFSSLAGLFPDAQEESLLGLGPLMHSWSGIVRVVPELLEVDHESGHFLFKGKWINSYEANVHLSTFGKSNAPVCFSLTGYGSAWCSAYFKRPLLEIETKCVACGDEFCEWEIRPWDDWGPEADAWKRSLSNTSISIYSELERTVSELSRVNASLESEVDKRVEENHAQLRTVCHDLDAPLSLALNDLGEYRVTGEGKALSRAVKSLNDINKMIGRLRESQSVTDGKFSLEIREFSLSDLVDEARDLVLPRAIAKDLLIEIDILPSVTVLSDSGVFRDHVLVNILTNAIKFSRRGASIFIAGEIDPLGRVSLSVRDQGIGIPEALLESIFNPRSVSSRLGTEGEIGTGYGMPLMKSYMRNLGGDITVVSQTIDEDPFEHGTTVTCVFARKDIGDT